MIRFPGSSSIPAAATLALVLVAPAFAVEEDEEAPAPWWTGLQTRPLLPETVDDAGLPTGWSVIGGPAGYAFESGWDLAGQLEFEWSSPNTGSGVETTFAHTLYLWTRACSSAAEGAPLSNWQDWCLVMAWLLAAVPRPL